MVGDLGDDLFADEAPQQPVAVHRLPQKMSSIAWCPDDEVRHPLCISRADHCFTMMSVHVISAT